MGLVASVGIFLFTVFFCTISRFYHINSFDLILQLVLFGSVLSAAFASLEHFQIVKKFNYAFLSPNMQVWHQNRAEVTFFNPNLLWNYLLFLYHDCLLSVYNDQVELVESILCDCRLCESLWFELYSKSNCLSCYYRWSNHLSLYDH